jgi:site-specific DNA-methyltransferase (adenine-specific)
MIELFNEDCMLTMSRYPDKHFDLAICDPPFGIGENWKKQKIYYRQGRFLEGSYKNNSIPSREYFDELKRVSKHQIIFGYNYFTEILGPTNYLLIWDKCSINSGVLYSRAEIAYTSLHKPVQIISVPWDGYRMGKETQQKKIHPHQKPVELYVQILRKYAKPGWKILDTHMGSGSSVIACHRLFFDVTASEIDDHYFKSAKKRIGFETKQQELFTVKEYHVETLFEDFVEAI